MQIPGSRSVVLYDPAISSINMGDHIISEAAREAIAPLLKHAFVMDVSTHLPASAYLRLAAKASHRFVLGSNLLRGHMGRLFRQWDINPWSAYFVKPAILLGVGWWKYGDKLDWYTKQLYRQALHPAALHSVRDSFTASMLSKTGIRNIAVTGCPTMWKLTRTWCEGIPTERSDKVVFTVTDYARDPEADRAMIRLLQERYDQTYLWAQGIADVAYVQSLKVGLGESIGVVPPDLAEFDAAMADADYIGTRLHAGIRAMRGRRRSLIIAIDNRAIEKSADFNIQIVHRGDLDSIAEWISGSDPTRIRLPEAEISRWLAQFDLSWDFS